MVKLSTELPEEGRTVMLSVPCLYHNSKLWLFKRMGPAAADLVCNKEGCGKRIGDDPRLANASWSYYDLEGG